MKRVGMLVLLLAISVLPSLSQVAVIVNKSVPANTLSLSTINDIYTLNKKAWSDGTLIVAFSLKGSETAEEAFYGMLGMRPLDIRKVWLRVQLSGEGKAPTTVTSEEEMIQLVSSTRGAIGFVSGSKVPPGVKIVAVLE